MIIAALLASLFAEQNGNVLWDGREQKLADSLALPIPSPDEEKVLLPASPTNAYADNPATAALGKALFFEKGLSASGTISCASCHNPAKGWADGLAVSVGEGRTEIAAPAIRHAAHSRWFFWDGRADSLWAQALQPLEGPLEMGGSRAGILRWMLAQVRYESLWREAFGSLPILPDPIPGFSREESPLQGSAWGWRTPRERRIFNQNFVLVGKALEAFEREIARLPSSSPFDRFADALKQNQVQPGFVLSMDAQRGFRLLAGKGRCLSCHFGRTFSDSEFHNLGFNVLPGFSFPNGRPAGIRLMRQDPFNGRGLFSDDTRWQSNEKILYLSLDAHVDGTWKTPTLRNVGNTAPYMHDGRFQTLREVVDFYSELPGEAAFGHREETLQPANFSDREKSDLIAFLRSLNEAETAD